MVRSIFAFALPLLAASPAASPRPRPSRRGRRRPIRSSKPTLIGCRPSDETGNASWLVPNPPKPGRRPARSLGGPSQRRGPRLRGPSRRPPGRPARRRRRSGRPGRSRRPRTGSSHRPVAGRTQPWVEITPHRRARRSRRRSRSPGNRSRAGRPAPVRRAWPRPSPGTGATTSRGASTARSAGAGRGSSPPRIEAPGDARSHGAARLQLHL